MRKISFREFGLKYTLSPDEEPIINVKPGESLILEVEDASSGQIRSEVDRRDKSRIPFGNPVLGPIYIEGAEEGDAVSIYIEEINPTIGQGATYITESNDEYLTSVPILKFAGGSFPCKTRICPIRDGLVYFSEKVAFPYQPMIGTIGVAPRQEAEALSSSFMPGRHGGNMDLPDIHPGSRVIIPVFHEGALLYLGDVHAVQGDGEISGTAVEMPAEVKVKVGILKGKSVSWPRVEDEDEIIAIATSGAGRSLEDAIKIAFLELILWMEERYGIDRFDGLMLCSQIGKVRIGNLWTAAAKIQKKYLNPT